MSYHVLYIAIHSSCLRETETIIVSALFGFVYSTKLENKIEIPTTYEMLGNDENIQQKT